MADTLRFHQGTQMEWATALCGRFNPALENAEQVVMTG